MEKATKVFMEYAAAFEQTYVDDDWSRLEPFFSEHAVYEVRGGLMACYISGLKRLKNSFSRSENRGSNDKLSIRET